MNDIEALLGLYNLPEAGPARINWILSQGSSPVEAVEWLQAGKFCQPEASWPKGLTNSLLRKWHSRIGRFDFSGEMSRYSSVGITLLTSQSAHWKLHDDPDAPHLLFAKGNLDLLHKGAIAIVGTRRCTSVGKRVAKDFGRSISQAGVAVVSGLASGVDRYAHEGALQAKGGAIAVVGSGIDMAYPKGNAVLWETVSNQGLLLSEYPLGVAPRQWHFPARNRLIAALSAGVVVVESHARGGSLLTVEQALIRDKPVMAVPGSVLSAASEGSNKLLLDGATPVLNYQDALVEALGFCPQTAIEPLLNEFREGSLHAEILAEAQGGEGRLENVLASAEVDLASVYLAVRELVDKNLIRLVGSKLELMTD